MEAMTVTGWHELPDWLLEDTQGEFVEHCDNCGSELKSGQQVTFIQKHGIDLVFCDEECTVDWCENNLIESGVAE
mgnify:CR=1 FL=1